MTTKPSMKSLEDAVRNYLDDEAGSVIEDLIDFIRRKAEANRDSDNAVNILDAGRRAYELMCGERVQRDSPIDDFIWAVVIVTEDSAVRRVADMLGLEVGPIDEALQEIAFNPERRDDEIQKLRAAIKVVGNAAS